MRRHPDEAPTVLVDMPFSMIILDTRECDPAPRTQLLRTRSAVRHEYLACKAAQSHHALHVRLPKTCCPTFRNFAKLQSEEC